MRTYVLGMLIALTLAGCRKKDDVVVQEATVEGLFGAMRGEVMERQGGLGYYPLAIYAVFFEANKDGIPRALMTYPLCMSRYGCCWDAYYYKDGRWQASPIRFLEEEHHFDPGSSVDAKLDDFYILTEEGQEPKFISIFEGERYVGDDKTESGLAMYREAFHLTVDAEGYLKKVPIPEFTVMSFAGKEYSWVKLKSPNDKLERVQVQRFPPEK